MVECFFTKYVVVGSNPLAVTLTSDITPVLNKEFLDIKANTWCRFTPKRVCDMVRKLSQIKQGHGYDDLIIS